MEKDYGSWTLAALKAELEKRNAKRTGKKAILVQRLQEYDRLFGDIVNKPEETYKITAPDAKLFRDINGDSRLPVLDAEDLLAFCSLTEHESEQARKMYEENYILTFRTASEGKHCFISSACASEMRKNVTYNILIKYEDHVVVEAQCECAAGMGPHAQCKHVLTVLTAILQFNRTKTINMRLSTTSSLQNFHHPSKAYQGGPIKAEDFKLREKDDNLKKITSFDPRPVVASNSKYNEFLSNHCINFCAHQQHSMPIAQIIKPADKRSLFHDHDYFEKTHEEFFLDTLLVTRKQIQEIEVKTRNNGKEWKKERLLRLQSSNFGKICKSKQEQKKKLAKSFMKNVEVLTTPILHGIKYEKKAIKKFTNITGLQVQKSGICIDYNNQFLGSTPDGVVGENCTVEVKCPFAAANKKITGETIPYIELCERSGKWVLKRTHDYFYQVQGQLLCTSRSLCYFCIYTNEDFCIIEVKRDNDFIANMLHQLKEFYHNIYKDLFICKYFYNMKF